MCGLVGLAGQLEQRHENMFKLLLCIDTIRGPHSTGVFRLKRYNDEVDVVKEVGTPWEGLFQTNEFKGFFTPWSRILAGHNRFTTVGETNKENAHPFQHGRIVGMHNGTLRSQELLDDHKDFEVDSENIIHAINKNGVDDTISKLHGAFALVWYDMGSKELNFIRNNERTLYYCYTQDGKVLIWASEEWMILAAAEKYKVNIGDIMPFQPMQHYKMEIGKNTWVAGKEQGQVIGKFRTKQMKEYVPAYPARRGNRRYVWPYDDYDDDLDDDDGWIFRWKAEQDAANDGSNLPIQAPTPQDYDFAKGKYVYFKVVGEIIGRPGGPYIVGYTTTRCIGIKPGLEVRIYHNPDTPEWRSDSVVGALYRAEIKDSKRLWSAKAMDYEHYLLTNRNSILFCNEPDKEEAIDVPFEVVEEEEEGDTTDEMYKVGSDNRLVTRDEFRRLVREGCAFCSDPIDLEDAPSLLWIPLNGIQEVPVCHFCTSQVANESALRADPPLPVIH